MDGEWLRGKGSASLFLSLHQDEQLVIICFCCWESVLSSVFCLCSFLQKFMHTVVVCLFFGFLFLCSIIKVYYIFFALLSSRIPDVGWWSFHIRPM